MARERTEKRQRLSAPEAQFDPGLEQRLVAAAWNEALAEITTGLAHDMNNCLTGILSMSDACLSQIDTQHVAHESLDLVKESAQKASRLIQQLMRVHHEKTGHRTYHDLNLVTSEAVELLKKVLRRRIELKTRLEARALPVYIDAVELRQVIVLLGLNAARSMPERGEIIFQTSWHPKPPGLRDFHGILPRKLSVCLTVSHSGGMSMPAQLASAFDLTDSIFTARQAFAGPLWAAKSLARKSKGAVSVESEDGKVTAFRLWVPQADLTEGAPS
jgi:signal transduction histidine kinase